MKLAIRVDYAHGASEISLVHYGLIICVLFPTFSRVVYFIIIQFSNITPPPQIESFSLLCRICEEMVPSIQIEAHSRLCAAQNQYDASLITIDARIEKVGIWVGKGWGWGV